ncbi:MAG: hypothetical protein OEZ34_14760 [Spirochaetia bacterium]|nr:hypothetical protein [Spirochaetia bacterium]
MGSVYSYIFIIIFLQLAVFSIQFFIDIHNAMVFSLIFAAGFAGTLLATVWKNLKPGPLFLSPVIFFIAAVLEIFIIDFFNLVSYLSVSNFIQFLDVIESTQMMKNFLMLIFISSLVSSGIWINRNFSEYGIRKGANDLDEVQKIYFWKEKFIPDENCNLFKYQKLLGRSLTLVGTLKNEIVCAVHSVRIDDTLFLYDFFVTPDWREKYPETGRNLIQSLLSRPELKNAGLRICCALVRKELENTLEDYFLSGFKEITENDPVLKKIRAEADQVLSNVYSDWKPLGRVDHYLIYSS